jgi:SNF2 family DNA or RNA helicase
LFRKTGTESDGKELKRREKLVSRMNAQKQIEKEQAAVAGRIYVDEGHDENFIKELSLSEWSPVLIVAPNAVVSNWVEDFKTWATFSVAIFGGPERKRNEALKLVEDGVTDVLLCGDSKIQNEATFNALYSADVKWKLIVIDEFHKFKNEKGNLAKNCRCLRDFFGCKVLGLSGTIMSNNHRELVSAMVGVVSCV